MRAENQGSRQTRAFSLRGEGSFYLAEARLSKLKEVNHEQETGTFYVGIRDRRPS